MDIAAFLSSGTTHVHTTNPIGNFAKSAKAIVLALAFGAALPATAQAADSLASTAFAPDSRSALYQGLISPEQDSSIRVVSTRYADAQRFLSGLPAGFLKSINQSPDSLARVAESRVPGINAYSLSYRQRTMLSDQTLCLINAAEEIDENLTYRNGVPGFSQGATLDPNTLVFANLSNLDPQEAKTVVTLHELSHCASHADGLPHQIVDPQSDLGENINVAFLETMADLAVVLYYGAQEGRFDNGLLAIQAFRNTIGFTSHTTTDNLQRILSTLDAQDFVGMSTPEIFDAVTEIGQDQAENHAQEFTTTLLKEMWERAYLHAKYSDDKKTMEDLDKSILPLMQKRAGENFGVNPYSRAVDLIDQTLDSGLRNPDRTRAMGELTVDGMAGIASRFGVSLTAQQVIKARFLDHEFNPAGTKTGLGVDVQRGLRVVDYTNRLEHEASAAMNVKMVNAPRFN